ncbi:MAG: LysE family transporter [Bacteroidales bacterium]|nr:LysE family transporter [Bacteroidales bacterium]
MDVIGLATHFGQGISIGFIASIPLGPIGVMCIQRTLNKGRRSGFVSGLGAATSDLIYALIAGFSVSFIMDFVTEQQKLLSIIGAVVLLCIGLKIYLSNPINEMRRRQHQEMLLKQVEEQVPQISRKKSSGLISDYFSTLFLTITNPLAIVLFLGAFSLVGGEKTIFTQIFLLGGVFIGASAWWLTLTLLVGLFRKKLTLKRLYYINKVAGGVIIFLVMSALFIEFVKEIILK